MPVNRCSVCIPHTYHDFFDYHFETTPAIGARCLVPFRNRERLGIVVAVKAECDEQSVLKNIINIIDDDAIIEPEILQFCQWIAHYYQAPLSEVISHALPKKLREGRNLERPTSFYYQKNLNFSLEKKSAKYLKLLELFAKNSEALSLNHLQPQGYSKTYLNNLVSKQAIIVKEDLDLTSYVSSPQSTKLTLNHEQANAVETIITSLDCYQAFLLFGITGSGKTEVYLQVIEHVLMKNQQVLVLVPEIGLTPQLLARFQQRFSQPIAVIHSNLNETERLHAWQLAKDGIIKLLIGTRAAIFTPLPKLGLIIIDEEHDSSLKQMDGVRYSARDAALKRAYNNQIPIILGSATPSLESLRNVALKKYRLLSLTTKALTNEPLHFQLIDMRNAEINEGIARQSLQIIKDHLAKNNQVLIFINRRGFAPVFLCHSCGWIVDCKACDSHLTFYQQQKILHCHHCGLKQAAVHACNRCQSTEILAVGAGTERIFSYLQKVFPETAMITVDRDAVAKKNALDNALQQIKDNKVQLIVGTQMMAKGHHFPNVSLTLVVNADMGFYNQDFRALEQLGQLLIQVAGRAGRAEKAGQIIIQTHIPDHPALNILIKKGYAQFADALLQNRKHAELPPYSYAAVIRAEAKHSEKVINLLSKTKNYLNQFGLKVMGPAQAPLAKRAHFYRWQLLVKSANRKQLQQALQSLRAWLATNKLANSVRFSIDVDPYDLS